MLNVCLCILNITHINNSDNLSFTYERVFERRQSTSGLNLEKINWLRICSTYSDYFNLVIQHCDSSIFFLHIITLMLFGGWKYSPNKPTRVSTYLCILNITQINNLDHFSFKHESVVIRKQRAAGLNVKKRSNAPRTLTCLPCFLVFVEMWKAMLWGIVTALVHGVLRYFTGPTSLWIFVKVLKAITPSEDEIYWPQSYIKSGPLSATMSQY